jgi:hypothetical protein
MIKAQNLSNHLPRSKTRKWSNRHVGEISELIFHQAFSEADLKTLAAYYTSEESHLDPLGCPSFPYTYAIDRKGYVYQCADLSELTWSLGGGHRELERKFISCLIMGDLDKTPPTIQQITAFYGLLKDARNTYANLGVHAHSHWGQPQCPGPIIQALVDAERSSQVVRNDRNQLTWGRAQITRFQRDNQLRVTGIFDYDTIRAIKRTGL